LVQMNGFGSSFQCLAQRRNAFVSSLTVKDDRNRAHLSVRKMVETGST
jgi:hypothetical protein